jgi:pilus assembly protein FimV
MLVGSGVIASPRTWGDALKHRKLNAGRFALSGLAIATACLWGLSAHALGLGQLRVQSALGEPLRAEIDVTSLSAEEAGTLTLRVASPDAYRAAGVDYNPVLPGTQVQLLKRADGRSYLRVTSDRAVVEPFVDVILEMNWASGRLVREYTVLLDPPGTPRNMAAAPAPSVAPAISAAPTPAAPAPRAASPAAASPGVAGAPAGERRAQPRPETPPAAPRAAAAPTAPAPVAAAGDQYRVRPGDSLSRIAKNLQPQSVSLDQMLVALFRGNPDAFVANNMNRLKAGEVLTVPSAEAAKQLAEPEAREVIRAQSADFDAYRQQLASGVRTQVTDEPARQAKGSVQAAVQDSKQAAAPTPDKLTLSQGAVKASAPEAAMARDAEKKDSATRVAELSRNVEELKRLQGETAGAGNAAPGAAAAPAAVVPAVTAAAASVAVVATVPAVPAAPPSAPAVVAAAPAAAPAVAPKAPMPAPAAAEAPGLLDSITDNPLLLPGAGLLVALLAGFGAYRLRGRLRKGERETSFLESRLQPDSFFGASGGQRIDTHDAAPSASSSASSMSYSLSQLDAIGDVDPVAEADVYLAYGRDLQAEEILKEAMRANPDRLAVRSKLLEVYAKRRDTKGFELLAGQLFALTGVDSDDWHKAQDLGRQIDPDNPLYAPGGHPDMIVREGGRLVEPLSATTQAHSVQAAPAAGPITAPGSLDVAAHMDLDLNLDLDGRPSSETSPGALEATRPFSTGAAIGDEAPFSLDLPGAGQTAAPLAGAGALDFDLGELTLDDDKPGMPKSAQRAGEDDFAASLPAFELGDDDADPLARKLELAEEFRQIGDTEGARDLLEEVVASADGALKAKAQGMLASLT